MASRTKRSGELSNSQSQSTKRPSQSTEVDFSELDKKRYVSDIVFYFMVLQQKRVPIKRADAIRVVGLSQFNREFQENLLCLAFEKIRDVFGYKICKLNEPNTFIMVNGLDPLRFDEAEHIKLPVDDVARKGLIFTVLSLIYMSGGVIREDQFVRFLMKMGLYGENPTQSQAETRESFVVGGNVKQFIEKELGSRQRYFDIRKEDGCDPDNPILEYRWGERSKHEVKPSKILKFVSNLYGTVPSAFGDQYRQALNEEGDEAFVVRSTDTE